MKKTIWLIVFALVLLKFQPAAAQNGKAVPPVNPNASREARALLKYLYCIQGKRTLSGMHNNLGQMSIMTDSVYRVTGKSPAIWGGDFGFSDSTHDIDNIKYRAFLIGEIKKQHQKGSIIVMTYHQANPVIGEPCPFEGGVVSKLTDEQWTQLLTPGSGLYKKWCKQMDLIASYIKQLQDAHIPIIFRPYHEMNGSWFWWGGRKGANGFIALWNQLYDYFTNHHHLNNILWTWTTDKPQGDVEAFYPGAAKVDLLGCDIYPVKGAAEVYPQEWFDKMQQIAKGKPVALTENSTLFSPELLKRQPWVWFMSWNQMLFNENTKDEIKNVYNDKQVINLNKLQR